MHVPLLLNAVLERFFVLQFRHFDADRVAILSELGLFVQALLGRNGHGIVRP